MSGGNATSLFVDAKCLNEIFVHYHPSCRPTVEEVTEVLAGCCDNRTDIENIRCEARLWFLAFVAQNLFTALLLYINDSDLKRFFNHVSLVALAVHRSNTIISSYSAMVLDLVHIVPLAPHKISKLTLRALYTMY